MTKKAHIFFDLDHTLWDFDANSLETLSELYEIFSLSDISKIKSPDFFISRYMHHNERFWAMYRENRISKSRLRSARFEAALRDIGLNEKSLAKKMGESYLEICPKKEKLKDGALEIVEALSQIYELHILSNGFHESQMMKLEVSGLAPFFKEVITSERANAKKPDRRIFSFAEALTKAKPHETWMVGDNLDIDIKGAKIAGWNAIHFNDRDNNKAEDVNTVHSLSELSGYFLESR